jgi:RNA polymerase sigma-70 factor (ECF subfamily)
MSRYHVEAAIAAVHARAPSIEATDWGAIVGLYDRLMHLAPSPIVGLNRAIAVGQRDGPEHGIRAIESIAQRERLDEYPFYHAARGELELRRGNDAAAREHFASALAAARNAEERRFYQGRYSACTGVAPTFVNAIVVSRSGSPTR